jgi:hypothetical protein
MTSRLPNDRLQKVGAVLSWLAGVAVIGMLISFGLFIRSNTTPTPPTAASLMHFLNDIAPLLGFVTLACEALALILLVVGFSRWRLRIFRSRRWMLSALGVGLVAVLVVVTISLAVVIIGGPT